MNFKWSDLEPLLAEAQQKGTVTLEFPNQNIAKKFRYSIYNLRRIKKLEKELSIAITDEFDPETQSQKYFVTIFKPVEFHIKKAVTPEEITKTTNA